MVLSELVLTFHFHPKGPQKPHENLVKVILLYHCKTTLSDCTTVFFQYNGLSSLEKNLHC